MSDGFCYTLSSGAEPTDDDYGPSPDVIADVERQIREMELSRAAAAASCGDDMVNAAVGGVTGEPK